MVAAEKFTTGKLLGVLLSFAGVVFVALRDTNDGSVTIGSDNNQPQGTLKGDLLALLSAAGYGLYTTVLRLQVPLSLFIL